MFLKFACVIFTPLTRTLVAPLPPPPPEALIEVPSSDKPVPSERVTGTPPDDRNINLLTPFKIAICALVVPDSVVYRNPVCGATGRK